MSCRSYLKFWKYKDNRVLILRDLVDVKSKINYKTLVHIFVGKSLIQSIGFCSFEELVSQSVTFSE